MNQHYKDSVVIFGLVAPVLLVAVVLGLGIHFRGKFEKTYEKRKASYESYKTVVAQREKLELQVKEQEPHMNRWLALFDKPAATSVNGFFRDFQKNYGAEELQLTAFKPSGKGGIGGASEQSSVQLQLAFRGTYRALQHAFLELETRMPLLQLDSIKLNTHEGQNVLNAVVIYTAWQK